MLADQQRKVMGCEVDSELLTAAETCPLLVSVSQVLEPESDTSGRWKMRGAARVFKDDRAAFLANKKASV